jgi:hypothetical protein
MSERNNEEPYVYQPLPPDEKYEGRIYGVSGIEKQPHIVGLSRLDAVSLAQYYQWVLKTPDLWEADCLRRENEMLKKIASYVPANIYIKAREKAGYPMNIRPSEVR